MSSCRLPAARALAGARFIQALPADRVVREHYALQVGPHLIESLRDADDIIDPEHIASIQDALKAASDAGLQVPKDLQDRWSDSIAELNAIAVLPRSQTTESTSDRPKTQTVLPVPLVCQLPYSRDGEASAEEMGMIGRLTVTIGPRGPGDEAVSWCNENAQGTTGDDKSLKDEARDALLLARDLALQWCEEERKTPRKTWWSRSARPRVDPHRVTFDLSLPEKQTPIEGSSMGLAMAATLAGALAGCLNGGQGVAPRADLAWTGVLGLFGKVIPVERSSLKTKIRAAQVAGLSGIVVPRDLGPEARSLARGLGWDGAVYQIGHVTEILHREELTAEWILPDALLKACEPSRMGARLAAVGVTAAVLGLFSVAPRLLDELGVHLFPFWRPLPAVSAMQVAEPYRALIRVNMPLCKDMVMPQFGRRTFEFACLSEELDIDSGPGPWLVYGAGLSPESGEPGYIAGISLRDRKEKFRYELHTSGLPVEPLDDIVEGCYSPKAGVTADIDSDGLDEIVFSSTINPTAINFLQVLEGQRELTGSVYHPGHLENLMADDIDGDGALEILALGFHEPSDGMSLVTLRREHFFANAPGTGETWSPEAQPCVGHLVVPIPPGYAEATGVTHLGGFYLEMRPRKEGRRRVLADVVASRAQGRGGFDYLISIEPPCMGLKITVTEMMADSIAAMLDRGLPADFGSKEFLDTWMAQFRCSDMIQTTWEPGDQ